MQRRRIVWRNLVTNVSVVILVGTELIALTWAGAWALGGLLNLPDIYRWILQAAGAILGAYGMYKFSQAASKVEPLTHIVDEPAKRRSSMPKS